MNKRRKYGRFKGEFPFIRSSSNSKNKQSFTFKTFEEANAFAKLKDGQVYKEKNLWKVRINRSVI